MSATEIMWLVYDTIMENLKENKSPNTRRFYTLMKDWDGLREFDLAKQNDTAER